jgi:hypothetical protein
MRATRIYRRLAGLAGLAAFQLSAASALAGNLVFPQFVSGELNGFRNKTRIILTNNSPQPDSGTVLFLGATGQSVQLKIGGQAASSVSYDLSGMGTFDISTDGDGEFRSGTIEVQPRDPGTSNLSGVVIYDFLGHQVSVASSPVSKAYRVYVSLTKSEYTGLAFFNPDAVSGVTARLSLVDNQGKEKAERDITLQPRQQLVRFVHEADLFKAYFDSVPQDFKGSLWVDVVSGPGLALLALLEDSTTGALTAVPGGNITFATAAGMQILGLDGKPVQLRGMSLGGWLVQEGYILQMPGYGSPSSIRASIQDLVGPDNTDRFFDRYTSRFVAEQDIAQIARWGLNSVRVPFNYRLVFDPVSQSFLQSGFDLLQRLSGWCRKYGIYLVLDMHCAPGGQNNGNISDSDGVLARLWTDTSNQDLTVRIWAEIARRFVHDPYVLGYDLLNEPVLPQGYSNAPLRSLYERLATEIRKWDPHHILFIEGNWYATDFLLLFPPFDSNMVYSFHKYWNATTVASIQPYLYISTTYNVPLWLGEFGENSNAWAYDVIRLVENNGIGWCWWTYKKVDAISSPMSVSISAGYRNVLDFWNGNATRPSPDAALTALLGMTDDLAIDRCTLHPDVVAMLTDTNYGATAQPYKALSIPGTINAVDYDIANEGVSYHDTVSMVTVYQGPISNSGSSYRNDGVDIEASADPEGFAWDIGWIGDGEWLSYTVNVAQGAAFEVDVRVASGSGGGNLRLYFDGVAAGQDLGMAATGGWQSWRTLTSSNVQLPAGKHTLKLFVVKGGFNLNLLRFRTTS